MLLFVITSSRTVAVSISFPRLFDKINTIWKGTLISRATAIALQGEVGDKQQYGMNNEFQYNKIRVLTIIQEEKSLTGMI